MKREQFARLARRFRKKRILVVGDVMLDEFLYGEVCRLSPEAPVPVVDIKEEVYHLGGAANVARNIRALGAACCLIGITGCDSDSERMLQELQELGIESQGLVRSPQRRTTKKTRIVARPQQVCRADREDRTPLSPAEQRAVGALLRKQISKSDGVVVSDYAKGLITPRLIKEIVSECKRHGRILVVDPKIKNFALYRDATVITPNLGEAEIAAQVDICDERSLVRAGEILLKITRAEAVLITRGREGMSLFEAGRRARHIPAAVREIFDVTGAGDTVVASLTLAAAAGASLGNAAVIANHAAGIAVGKLGTATASTDEIARALARSS